MTGRILRGILRGHTLLLASMMATATFAVEPVTVHHGRLQDFLDGEGDAVALHGDGHLSLAPALRPAPGDPLAVDRIWTLAAAADRLLVATGDVGRVWSLRGGRDAPTSFEVSGAPLSLLSGASGIYVGTGPGGLLLRRGRDGEVTTLLETGSEYVWDLALDGDGVLLACGLPARVLRWRRDGTVDTLLSTTDGHVRSLARRGARWLAGTAVSEGDDDGAGRVYEIGAQDPRLLVETEHDEVADLAVVAGHTYIAAMTVEDGSTPTATLLRLNADGASYPVWRSSGIWAGLLVDGDELIAVTREPTRILRLAGDAQTGAILARSDSIAPSAIALRGDGVLVLADGHSGRLWELGGEPAPSGHYDSPVHDAGGVAAWGAIDWAATGRVSVLTRSGNSAEPGPGWSPWSEALSTPGLVPSPSARYLQYRLRLEAGDDPPVLQRVSFRTRQANLPPRIDDVITFPFRGGAGALQNPDQIPLPGQQRGNGNGPAQRKSLRVLRWLVSDPNDDPLRVSLFLRGEGQSTWKLLEEDVEDVQTVVFDTERMPEGLTQLRVVVSDAAANANGMALTDTYDSPPFVIDNTPPVVTLQRRRESGAIVVEADLVDRISALRGARYAVDYDGATTRVAAVDGFFDSRSERLRFVLPPLTRGEHVVSVQAWDEMENVGVARIVVEVP